MVLQLLAGFNKSLEHWVRTIGSGAEFGMELASHEEWVVDSFNDLHEIVVALVGNNQVSVDGVDSQTQWLVERRSVEDEFLLRTRAARRGLEGLERIIREQNRCTDGALPSRTLQQPRG